MFYDRLTRRLHLTIGGKEYLLSLNLGGLEELESRSGKPITSLASGDQMSLSMLVDAFWIGLRDGGNGKRFTHDEGNQLASDFIEESENGFADLANVFMVLLAISGILGAAYRHDVLQKVGLEDKDGKPLETTDNVEKNA